MTAPTTTPLGTPVGVMLDDGYSTRVVFASNPNIGFKIKTVQPPGMDGGDAIDITTMHNTVARTKAARSLIDFTDATFTAAYNPKDLAAIRALINVEDSLTLHYPDETTEAFWGFLQKFERQEHKEGEQPEANGTIVVTNKDPISGEEELPVVTPGP